jgi:hypothetical protein
LRKVLAYASTTQSRLWGVSPSAILVVCVEERWLERYREAASRVRAATRMFFATLNPAERLATCAVWRTALGEDTYPLRSLASLVNQESGIGKEGS